MTREERLAAKLRENLRRRKSQAKALVADGDADPNTNADSGRSDSEEDSLPKDPPKS